MPRCLWEMKPQRNAACLKVAGSGVSLKKAPHFIEESAHAGIIFQHQMIAPFERNEVRAWNARGKPASLFERLCRIVAAMQHEGWDANARQEIDDVNVLGGQPDADSVLGRSRVLLQVVEPAHLLGRATRQEARREDLAKCRVSVPNHDASA